MYCYSGDTKEDGDGERSISERLGQVIKNKSIAVCTPRNRQRGIRSPRTDRPLATLRDNGPDAWLAAADHVSRPSEPARVDFIDGTNPAAVAKLQITTPLNDIRARTRRFAVYFD